MYGFRRRSIVAESFARTTRVVRRGGGVEGDWGYVDVHCVGLRAAGEDGAEGDVRVGTFALHCHGHIG